MDAPGAFSHVVMPQQGPVYRSARGLATAVMVLLGVHAATGAALCAALPTARSAVYSWQSANLWTLISAAVMGFAAFLQFFVFIATAIVFLIWLHRSYANLPALNPDSLYGTKGIVAGWFIPFVNLVHGYRSVADLYFASQPPVPNESGFVTRRAAPIVGMWWGFYLASGVVARIGRIVDREEEVGFAVASEVLSIVAAVLCLSVVHRIERRQRDQHIDLTRRAEAAQPPPADRQR
jgi:hypothetical protein